MKKILLVCVMAACGGSGLDTSLKINTLSDSEITDECQYIHDTYPKKTFTCDDGQGGTDNVSIGGNDVASCTSSLETLQPDIPNCTATVGDVEDCFDFEYNLSSDQFCGTTSVTPPSSCQRANAADCEGSDTSNRGSNGLPSPAKLTALLARLQR
jgi:hypothetical protein